MEELSSQAKITPIIHANATILAFDDKDKEALENVISFLRLALIEGAHAEESRDVS